MVIDLEKPMSFFNQIDIALLNEHLRKMQEAFDDDMSAKDLRQGCYTDGKKLCETYIFICQLRLNLSSYYETIERDLLKDDISDHDIVIHDN